MTISGSLHDSVWPPLPALAPAAADARTRALEALREYLSLVHFQRQGAPRTFRIPKEQIHIEQPDSFENLRFPAVAFIAGVAPFDAVGLGGSEMLEDTRDLYGVGTVLLRRGEHIEELTMEVWEDTIPGRRALRAALSEALAPIEESSSLRLRLDDYYGLVADYAQLSSQVVDDIDTAKGRRRSLHVLRVAVPVVQLVRYAELQPQVIVEVTEG